MKRREPLRPQRSQHKQPTGAVVVLAQGVIAEQAIIAEKAGAVAVMALERVPADIRTDYK